MKKSEILKIINEEIDLTIIPESADQSHRLTEAFKKGDKVKYLGHPGIITNVSDYNGKTYYSVAYNKGTGKTKAKGILSTDGSITEASAKDKFGAPPMNKWWTGDKDALMSAIYHAQRQLPPTNKADYEKNWKSIVNQLQKKYPAPTDIFKKKLTEVQAMNMDTVPYNTIMKMKPGSTIKMKDGKIRTKDKFGNWRADTDPNDIIANRDVIKYMKGMKGFNIGNGRVRIEGKLTETKKIKPHGLGYRINARRAMGDFKRGENIAAVSKSGKGSFKIEDIDDFRKYHPKFWDFAYIVKESVTEALARGLKPLLTLGSKVSWKTMSEDALLDLSDKFDRIDDEVAEDVASYLNIAIENKQDGKQGLATKALKAFNKACKDALAGKPVKSVFEGKLNEGADPHDVKLLAKAKPGQTLSLKGELWVMMGNPKNQKRMFQTGQKPQYWLCKKGKLKGTIYNSDEMAQHLYRMAGKGIGYKIKEGKLTEAKVSYNFSEDELKRVLKLLGRSASTEVKMIKAFEKAFGRKLTRDELFEGKLNEMDINDPILVAIRARKTDLKKKAALPKVKKISTKQYYKLMDAEIDLIDQMKDAAKDYERLDSEMNQDAGQKGDAWTDADANRYGGDLNKLQTKIEKLAKQKLAVKKQIMNYRIN